MSEQSESQYTNEQHKNKLKRHLKSGNTKSEMIYVGVGLIVIKQQQFKHYRRMNL